MVIQKYHVNKWHDILHLTDEQKSELLFLIEIKEYYLIREPVNGVR